MSLVHLACGATCEHRGGPEPPDPDRWGNITSPWRCRACGKRTSTLHGPHSGVQTERGFEYSDRIEWTIPLD